MISNRQLAQNEERKSEHHACREDGSDLGKRGCTVSRSKFRCLIPPARTKNVHVGDRKSTRLNSSHVRISYAVFCLKKKKQNQETICENEKKNQRNVVI